MPQSTHARAWAWPMACALAIHAWALSLWQPQPTPQAVTQPPQAASWVMRRVETSALAPAQPASKSPTILPPQKNAQNQNQASEFKHFAAIEKVATMQPVPTSTVAPDPPVSLVAAVPASAQLRYAVQFRRLGGVQDGAAVLSWQHDGESYRADLATDHWFGGPRRLHSEGQLTDQGLVPRRYAERARGEQAAHFDAAKGWVRYSNNRPAAPWQSGVQDRLSVMLQLSAWLSANAAQVARQGQVTVPTSSLGGVQPWVFAVEHVGESAHGEPSVLKLTRALRGEHDAALELWFAASAQWLPSRMRITRENGDFFDMTLSP